MTREGWREAVLKAVREHDSGDSAMLDLMARVLEEQDHAKQVLRDKGYGCTGMPWLDTVAEVQQANQP